ncbi:hypothetical protein R0D44_01190, partial [Escherichia coli]
KREDIYYDYFTQHEYFYHLAELAEVAEVAEVADFDKSEFNPSDSDRKIWTGIRKLISFFKK